MTMFLRWIKEKKGGEIITVHHGMEISSYTKINDEFPK